MGMRWSGFIQYILPIQLAVDGVRICIVDTNDLVRPLADNLLVALLQAVALPVDHVVTV